VTSTSPSLRARASFGLLALAVWAGSASAQEAEEIMRHADQDQRAEDERGVVEMALIRGSEREMRSMEILLKTGESDDDINMLRFLTPQNVRGTAVLTQEQSGRADDQWVYLPALRRSRRIASSQRTQRFAGTDFTYEDIRSEDFDHHTYSRLDDAQEQDMDCFVVEATPHEDYTSGYSRRVIYVEKERYLIVKIEYYDRRDRHSKTLINRDFEQTDGLWRARMSMMEDHQRESRTVWRFTERAINPGLPDSVFSVENMERGL
jgi:outer membrane lipoprotein-sorting protein